MISNSKSQKPNYLLLLGTLMLILLLISVYFYTRFKNDKIVQQKYTPKTNTQDMPLSDFEEYKNRLYGYSIKYSPDLEPEVLTGQGGYLEFVRFEAPLGSDKNGFAVGVNSSTLIEETKRIKEAFASDQNAKLSDEKDTMVYEIPAKRLYYKPVDETQGQERVVIIFTKDKFTYSLSTFPSEIDKLTSNFALFEVTPLGTMSE